MQVDSFPAEPQGKPKNTGVGSLSPFQRIFWMQEENQGLPHCRRTLYQLSYQGSPNKCPKSKMSKGRRGLEEEPEASIHESCFK